MLNYLKYKIVFFQNSKWDYEILRNTNLKSVCVLLIFEFAANSLQLSPNVPPPPTLFGKILFVINCTKNPSSLGEERKERNWFQNNRISIRRGEIYDMSVLIIYVQTHLPSWEMGDFPGNKHETLAFNTSLPKALPSSCGGEIALADSATRHPTCVTSHSNAASVSLAAH